MAATLTPPAPPTAAPTVMQTPSNPVAVARAIRNFTDDLVRVTSDDVPAMTRIGVIPEDSTIYARNSGEKREAYARADVRQYVIVDVARRLAEVYADPDMAEGTYPPPTVVSADGVVALRVGDGETFSLWLADVLP